MSVKKKSLTFTVYEDGSADFHSFTEAKMLNRTLRVYVTRLVWFRLWRWKFPYLIVETKIVISNGGLQIEKS